MESSDLLVRSGTSAELIKLILQLRQQAAASLNAQASYSCARLWVPKLQDFVANSYFFYFEYAQTTCGYAILRYPLNTGSAHAQIAGLLDFFVPDQSDKSFALGAVMLSYIAAHCRTMGLNSLRVDFRSCEASSFLQVLLKTLLPDLTVQDEAMVLSKQQLDVLAQCMSITPQPYKGDADGR